MATPTTGSLNVIGSSGGMAPFPTSVYADPDEAGSTWATGSGGWEEGRWAFQLIDDGTDEVYDSGLMDLTCPITGITATAYTRYGAAPIAGCVIFDPGTYHWRVKYQNRDGDWSAWSDSASFTVANNTRTKVYVDGTSGNDANDGLSAGAAKQTMNAALALVTGDDYEVILKDDTTINCTVGTNLASRSGLWIHRSGDGTNKPVVTMGHSSGHAFLVEFGTDSLIDGIEFDYDGSTERFLFDVGSGKSNVAWLNIDTNYMQSLAEISSGTDFEGLVVYGCRMLEQCRRYMIFAGGPRVINILGCQWDKGSEVEHIVRVTYNLESDGSDPAAVTQFISVDFTVLDQANRGKTNFRNYSKKFSGAYRTDFRKGAFSVGDIDVTGVGFQTTSSGEPTGPTERFGPYRYDCCRFYMEDDIPHPQTITIHECVKDVVFASCHIYQRSGNCVLFNWRSNGDDDPIENVKFLGCSFFVANDTEYSLGNLCIHFSTAISNENLVDIGFRGCLFSSVPENFPVHFREFILLYNGIPNNDPSDPLFLSENVFWDSDHLPPPNDRFDLVDNKGVEPDVAYKDVTTLNAESWAAGNIQEGLLVDQDTAEPAGTATGWQTVLTDISGLFESLNGEVYDRTASTWAAGAWQPVGSGTGDVAGYPTEDVPVTSFIGLSAGGQFIVLET